MKVKNKQNILVRAIQWHSDFIKWSKENNCTATEEYEITKFALECINFRMKHDQRLRQAAMPTSEAV